MLTSVDIAEKRRADARRHGKNNMVNILVLNPEQVAELWCCAREMMESPARTAGPAAW
jgi:hypothetical protein